MRATIVLVGGAVDGSDPGARHSLARRDGVVLTLVDDDGAGGMGEASPLPGYSTDDLATVQTELAAWQPPRLDPHASPATLLEHAAAGVRTPSARFAVEAAVLDWIGRRTGLPAHRVLGAGPAPREISQSHLLPLPSAASVATALRARGVRHLKLKVSGDIDVELRALRAVRAAVPDAEIRLDANGMLPAARVMALCAAYADAGVALVEEPCSVEALLTLPRLAVPVALDESLARADAPSIMTAVAHAQAFAAVILKPTTLGGLTRCLELAAMGAALGAEPVVTHTFDGPVAMAAAAELALALPAARMTGLAPHGYLRAYPRLRGAAIGEAAVTSHDAPGLGLREAP
jgi:o-succinylbenzoate synthase